MLIAMHYPGGKAKAFQHVINLIPPHRIYIEPFLGFGSVLRAKAPSTIEIGVDRDQRALERCGLQSRGVELIQGDGITYLEKYPFKGHEIVYCDPPYLPETRRRDRVYRFDATDRDHERLLQIITCIDARVLISGYDNSLYRCALKSWHVHRFQVKAHDGLREECLWYNYEPTRLLHDYRYLGNNFRERQTIKRRFDRLKRRILSLSIQEQSHLRQWLAEQ